MKLNRDRYPAGVPEEFFETASRLFSQRRLLVEVVVLSAIGIGLAIGGVDPIVVAVAGVLCALSLAAFEVVLGRYRVSRWRRQTSDDFRR